MLWYHWILAIAGYVGIGVMIGIPLTYLYNRHMTSCREDSCWCHYEMENGRPFKTFAAAGSYAAFLFWPASLAVLFVLKPFVSYVFFPFFTKLVGPALHFVICRPIVAISKLYTKSGELGEQVGRNFVMNEERRLSAERALKIQAEQKKCEEEANPANQRVDAAIKRVDDLLGRAGNYHED